MSVSTPELPVNLTYGQVGGRFLLAVMDKGDTGREPDGQAASGKIRFTPAPGHVINATSTPAPTFVVPRTIECSLDSDGYLIDGQSARDVWLVAGDNPNTTPTNWTYKVTFDLVGVTIPPFDLLVQGGVRKDLALAAPQPSTPGTTVVVSESSRIAAEAAADAAQAALESITSYAPVLFLPVGAPLPPDAPNPVLVVNY